MIKFVESTEEKKVKHGPDEIAIRLLKPDRYMLEPDGTPKRPKPVPIGVIPGASHSGVAKGIMRSVVLPKSTKKSQVAEILKCLKVVNKEDYVVRGTELDELTKQSQKQSHRYVMLVFVIKDDQGDPVSDYDLFLLGGVDRDPDKLTKGFFVDRQQNASHRNHLVYYVDYDVITKNKLTGFRVIARPEKGFAFYHAVEYHSDGADVNSLLKPNETFYIEIVLHRSVDKNVFRFDNASDPKLHTEGVIIKSETRHSFKGEEPSTVEVDEKLAEDEV